MKLKKIKLIIVLIMAVAVIMPIQAADRVDSNIRFNDLYGEVSIRPNSEDDDAYEYAEFDTIIYEDDRIRTKEESGALLGLEDMSTYIIKPESIVVIHTEENNVSKLEMIAGGIWANIKKMAEGKSIECEMSHCVFGIKGTTVKMTQSKDGMTNRIEVLKGLVTVTLDDGITVEVAGGHRLETNDDPNKPFKLIQLTSMEINNLENEFNKEIEKMDEKLDGQKLNDKLSEFASGIKAINSKFETSYNNLQEQKETAYQAKELDMLLNLTKQLDALTLETDRYKGALKEAEITISVARKKSAIASLQNTVEAVNDCWATISKIEKFPIDLQKAIDELKAEINKQSEKTTIDLGKLDSIYNDVMSFLEGVTNGSSYAQFRDTKDKCEKTLNCIKNGEASEQYTFVCNSIEKAIKKLESIPEIATATIRDIDYIGKNISSYAKEARKRINKYNTFDDTTNVETKKSLVENAERTLSKCKRIGKVYTRTNTAFEKIEKEFEKSSYKTSEYKDCKKKWEKVNQAMPELEHEISELSSCIEAVKSLLKVPDNK